MKTPSLLLLICLLLACKHDKTPPLSEQLRKVWLANTVKEGSSTVFAKGAAGNVKPGYSQFRLDLSATTAASLTEFDGNTFAGTWELSADEKTLTLKNLAPQPSGTGGVISYTIGSVSDVELTLTRTGTSVKTGNTVNTYSLTK